MRSFDVMGLFKVTQEYDDNDIRKSGEALGCCHYLL